MQHSDDATHSPSPHSPHGSRLQELRAIARSVLRGQRCPGLLQTTALIHEAWIKVLASDRTLLDDDRQFAAVASRAIRSVLVDEARREGRDKRGGSWRRIPLDQAAEVCHSAQPAFDILELNAAIDDLAVLSQRRARVVELRFFGGLTVDKVALALDVSRRTVESEWEHARAWLRIRLSEVRRREEEP